MMPPSKKPNARWTRPFLLWSGAVIFSLMLNLALFGLMPGLSTGVTERPGKEKPLRMLDIIRIKRSEPPPPEKKFKPEPETIATQKKTAVKAKLPVHPVIDSLPRLDFDINPKLPVGPPVLPSPDMETITVEVPDVETITVEAPDVETITVGAPDMDGFFDIGDLDTELMPLSSIPPMYPLRAKRRNIEGWVNVKFHINRKGHVEKVKIIDSHPPGIFDRSAVQAVSSWRFKPGTVEGVPVKTVAEQTIKFKLTKK